MQGLKGHCLCVAAVTVAVCFPATGGVAQSQPQRIVSLNLCTDQILMELVEKERIAALSFLASDPMMSALARQASAHARIRGSAEGVLALDPDLVFAGAYTTPATVSLLRRFGKRVEIVGQPATFAGIRDVVRQMANAVGEPARGADMIADFERRLDAVKEMRQSRPATALALQVNGIVAGPGSLLDEAMRHAGLYNKAKDAKLGRGGRLSLESLVTDPPDALVLEYNADEFRTVLADNLRHPVVARLAATRPSIHLPMRLYLCGTPHVAEAVELLARLKRDLVSTETVR